MVRPRKPSEKYQPATAGALSALRYKISLERSNDAVDVQATAAFLKRLFQVKLTGRLYSSLHSRFIKLNAYHKPDRKNEFEVFLKESQNMCRSLMASLPANTRADVHASQSLASKYDGRGMHSTGYMKWIGPSDARLLMDLLGELREAPEFLVSCFVSKFEDELRDQSQEMPNDMRTIVEAAFFHLFDSPSFASEKSKHICLWSTLIMRCIKKNMKGRCAFDLLDLFAEFMHLRTCFKDILEPALLRLVFQSQCNTERTDFSAALTDNTLSQTLDSAIRDILETIVNWLDNQQNPFTTLCRAVFFNINDQCDAALFRAAKLLLIVNFLFWRFFGRAVIYPEVRVDASFLCFL
jgi:hypothetical protein